MRELHPIIFDSNPDNGEIYIRHDNKTISLDTYFNMFDHFKWRKYTTVKNIYLKVKASGYARLEICSLNKKNEEKTIHLEEFNNNEPEEWYIRITPEPDTHFFFCKLINCEKLSIQNLAWCTDEDAHTEVHLRCAICTFKKEEFVYNNLRVLDRIRIENKEIKNSLSVVIADNGSSLDPKKTDYEFVEVYNNVNTGGAGGFARAMIEILQSPKPCTHILIMDDDIEIASTSLILSINLLGYLKDEYKRHFIGGAMMNRDQRNIMHASLEWFDEKEFWSNTGPIDLNNRASVLGTSINSFHPNQYQAWWYCIIPSEVVSLDSLPLPIFFQNDDVEYSFRNKAKVILLNGISVWHEPFYKKIQNIKPYFVLRNALIVSATQKLYSTKKIIRIIKKRFKREICQFNYSGAQVYIDILEDFIKGPEILKSAEKCSEILKLEITRNEKMVPLKELGIKEPIITEEIMAKDRLRGIRRRLYDLTLNGHHLPSFMRNKEPIVIHCTGEQGPRCYMRETVIAINPLSEEGVVRKFDREQGQKLINTFKKVYSKFLINKESLLKEYREIHKYIISIEFYKHYLGLH